ncbi:MAG: hypothetical protein CME06_03435 [Gemmatimonadetes bacterium]|nr:hypothetical protein [Gemmatimonadota bacterium]
MRFSSSVPIAMALALVGCEVPPLDPVEPPPPAFVAPGGLGALVGTDRVTLTWSVVEGAVDYAVYRERTDEEAVLLDTTIDTVFVDLALPAGVPHGYSVAARDGDEDEGARAELAQAVAGFYDIELDGGRSATSDPQVGVSPIAPASVSVAAIGLGGSEEAALSATPTPFTGDVAWFFTGDDGLKRVWGVLYTEQGVRTGAFKAEILLDRSAEIQGVDWCVVAGADCAVQDTVHVARADTVRFRVLTSETDLPGTVSIQIGEFAGDQTSLTDVDGDGLYEGFLYAEWTEIRTTGTETPVSAFLTDAVGNVATPARASDAIVIR